MSPPSRARAPRLHRLVIGLLSLVLTLLLFWALDFVVDDIGRLPGPDYDEIDARIGDADLRAEVQGLQQRREALETQIANQSEIQRILSDSMTESRSTMNQLIEVHRLSLEKGVTPTAEEQRALAESQTLFLTKQTEFQSANETIARLSEELRSVAQLAEDADARRAVDSRRVRTVHYRERRAHELKLAALQLAFLVPVLVLAAWFVLRKRRHLYALIYYAVLIAAFGRVALVMHEYFPRRWFNYIAVVVSIAVVVAFLVQVVRMAASPKADWLLRRYREAYNQHRCPVCAFPILRGPMKYALWRGRGPRNVPSRGAAAPDTPYTCPSCGATLYDECGSCGSVRHTYLPYCGSCGDHRSVGGEA